MVSTYSTMRFIALEHDGALPRPVLDSKGEFKREPSGWKAGGLQSMLDQLSADRWEVSSITVVGGLTNLWLKRPPVTEEA